MKQARLFTVFWVSLLVFPLFLILLFSVGSQWVFPQLIPNFQLETWKNLLANKELLSGILLSFAISIVVATLSTAAAFVVSRYISLLPGANKWLTFAYFPFALSPIIYAVCLLFYFNYFDLAGTVFGVIVAQFLILFPYGIIVCSGFWNKRIHDLEALTTTLGGNRKTRWKDVLWPMGKEILGVCFFQSFLISWFDYGMTQFIGVGQVKTLTMYVYAYIGEANPYLAAVASSLLILPPLVFLIINKRLVFRKEWT